MSWRMTRALRLVAAATVLAATMACGFLEVDDAPPPPTLQPAPPAAPPVMPVAAPAPPLNPAFRSPRHLRFDNLDFHLAYQSFDGRTAIEEHIPAGDRPSRWLQMVAIRHFHQETEPRAVALRMVAALQQKTPPRRHELLTFSDSPRVSLDFIDYEGDIFEFNVWRFEPSASGVIAHQYAWRAYDAPGREAMTQVLRPHRVTLRQRFLDASLPAPAPPLPAGQQRYFTRTGDATGEVATD